MRNTTFSLFRAFAIAAIVATTAHAQTPPAQPAVPATPTVNLTMEHKHVLKENLLKTGNIKPEAAQVDLERGKKVPASVQLHPFPDEISSKIPQIKSHQYFVADDALVIVQVQGREIVEVVK